MDPLTAARRGFNPKQVEDTSPQDREVADATRSFLELWGPIKASVRDQYIEALKGCPINDDMQRFRLAEALNIIEAVEKHAIKVHSDADVNLKRVIKTDFATKRWPF